VVEDAEELDIIDSVSRGGSDSDSGGGGGDSGSDRGDSGGSGGESGKRDHITGRLNAGKPVQHAKLPLVKAKVRRPALLPLMRYNPKLVITPDR